MVKGRCRKKMLKINILQKDNFLTPIYVYIGEMKKMKITIRRI